MAQKKVHSLAEAITGNTLGFLLSMAAWPLVSYLTHVKVDLLQNFEVTLLFTIIATAKQYALRRFFDRLK